MQADYMWRIYQNKAFAVSLILFTIFYVQSYKCLNCEFQVIFDDDVTNTSISMSHLHNRSFRLIFNFMSRSGTSNHTKCLNCEFRSCFFSLFLFGGVAVTVTSVQPTFHPRVFILF